MNRNDSATYPPSAAEATSNNPHNRPCTPNLEDLERLLLGAHAGKAIVDRFDLIVAVAPELAAMQGCPQNTPYHIYDVLQHTAHVVEESPRTPLARWAALLHDAGKPAARTTDAAGQDHFAGHPEQGASIARELAQRLKMPPSFVRDLELLVAAHEWFFVPTEANTRDAIERLGGRTDLYRSLLELQIADNRAKSNEFTDRLDNALERLRLLDALVKR